MDEAEIIKTLQEALDLANTAVLFDKQQIWIGAVDYYDKTILNLDEALMELPEGEEKNHALALRHSYEDRMETIREYVNREESLEKSLESIGDTIGSSLNSITSVFGGSTKQKTALAPNADKKHGDKKNQTRPLTHTFTELPEDELTRNRVLIEKPPTGIIGLPYWQLRAVRETTLRGGYLSHKLYVPKEIWINPSPDLRMSGLPVKLACLRDIMTTISTSIAPLLEPVPMVEGTVTLKRTEIPLALCHELYVALCTIRIDFAQLQVCEGIVIGGLHIYTIAMPSNIWQLCLIYDCYDDCTTHNHCTQVDPHTSLPLLFFHLRTSSQSRSRTWRK